MFEKESKTLCGPTFDRESSAYQMQWVQFKTYEKASGFDKELKPTIEDNMPASQAEADKMNESNKKKLKTVKRNDEVIANLTLAFTANDILNKIMNGQTAE